MIDIIVVLVVVGVALYFVNTVFPGPAWIKTLINVLVGLFVFIWVLGFFGFHSSIFHLPALR